MPRTPIFEFLLLQENFAIQDWVPDKEILTFNYFYSSLYNYVLNLLLNLWDSM
jgi:hypothetical protein